MVELKLTNGYSPILFTVNGYKLVVMPMLTTEANEQAKKDREVKAETEPTEPETTEQEPVTEQAEPKKAKRSRAKEPVAV
jgi:hypothetical protein